MSVKHQKRDVKKVMDLWASNSEERAEHKFEGLQHIVVIKSHWNIEGHLAGERK